MRYDLFRKWLTCRKTSGKCRPVFGKIFETIYDGSLRGRSHEILVFTNMIVRCRSKSGEVDRHFRSISEEVGISIEECRAAILNLEAPDPESRSPECEGRRIIRLDDHRDWGWRIVNYDHYRGMRNEEDRREQTREAVRRHRAKQAEESEKTPAKKAAKKNPKKKLTPSKS